MTKHNKLPFIIVTHLEIIKGVFDLHFHFIFSFLIFIF